MKKSFPILLATILLIGFTQCVFGQSDFYWANPAGGSWHVAANWRIGAVNGAVTLVPPSNLDNVFFTNASFTSNATVTVTQASAGKNFTYEVNNRAITLQINSLLDVAGSFSITNGNNANKLSITTAASAANISNGNATIRFISPTPTTIKSHGTNPTTFGAPVVFNGAGWTLLDNMTLSNRVTFTSGHVRAIPSLDPRPSTDPVLRNSNTVPASPRLGFTPTTVLVGASTSSHVVGYLQIVDANNSITNFTLPVGDGSAYRPVLINSISNGGGNTPTNIITRYYSNYPIGTVSPALSTAFDAPLNSVNPYEYWYVGREGGSASPRFTLDYNYTNPNLVDNYMAINKWTELRIAGLHTNTDRWAELPSSPSAPNTATTVAMTGAANTNNAWFTIARTGNFPLPVQLVSFTGQLLDGQVQLKWRTSTEKNTSHFVVEKSQDGKSFSAVVSKKAQGTSAAIVSYSAFDPNPYSGSSYYRLRMVDLDGTEAYSKLVTVSTQDDGLQVRTYPNPSKGTGIQVAAANGQKLVLLSVSDMLGKLVSFQSSNPTADSLAVQFTEPLPAGFYLATLATTDETRQQVKVKFVVQ